MYIYLLHVGFRILGTLYMCMQITLGACCRHQNVAVKHIRSCQYSGPCDLRPLHFTIPSILRSAISDNILMFSIQISLYFKTTSNLRPKYYGWRGGLKMQGPLYQLSMDRSMVAYFNTYMEFLIYTMDIVGITRLVMVRWASNGKVSQ